MAEILKSVITCDRLPQRDCPTHIEADDVKRGLANVDQKWSRGQVEAQLANMPPCLIGMEACVGADERSPAQLPETPSTARASPAKARAAWG
jgi:hypothetical protein